VDEDRLFDNPAANIVVRNVETEKDDDEKGFSDKDARTILGATLVKRSPKMSVEMAAARRWIPWICAYKAVAIAFLRDRISESGMSHTQLADKADCERSHISEMPGRVERCAGTHKSVKGHIRVSRFRILEIESFDG
jgi:hypothetical protein